MGCFLIPTAVAVVHGILRTKIGSWKNSVHHLWLSLLLIGGAVFGLVDHAWHGELFMVSEDLFMDLLLGFTITVTIFVLWAIIVVLDNTKTHAPTKPTN